MAKKNRRSLFSRLMVSVALPEIIIFSTIAVISYIQLKDLFHDLSKERIENIEEELISIIKFQDVSLSQISQNLDKQAQDKMKQLRFNYFLNSDSIETADLERIRKEIGMKQSNDIYIINKDGIVVNTTLESDLNFDLFSIGPEFKSFLEGLFAHDYYTPAAMSLETNTRKFKKYIYQRSKDENYIIQLGLYSTEADKFNEVIARRFREIESSPNDISSIDLILAPWKPFSLYKGSDVKSDEVEVIQSIFNARKDSVVDHDDYSISYLYFDMADKSTISWKGLLRVTYDKERERATLIGSLVQKISLFGFGMILLFAILLFNVRIIIRPIHMLSNAARKLGDGHLDARAESEGTKEMVFLSESFNHMAENLEKSHLEITKKNKEILSSITYAKRIQEAILPSDSLLAQGLNDHFIYYRPKDIVAGDFYWYEQKDDEVFIAAADCTGHGVPGAMVSVVCSNSLNRAVNELDLRDPAKILDAVRDLVIETFEKSDLEVKDGMDICLVRVNTKKKEVVYSGAQNSLYRITRLNEEEMTPKSVSTNDLMLLEYKADKQPIGVFTSYNPFTETRINYEKGDVIYLFTDGFADQFGGPDGRKFMYKPFKRLLLDMSGDEVSAQRSRLDKEFDSWKGEETQVDDVCVIGIRLS